MPATETQHSNTEQRTRSERTREPKGPMTKVGNLTRDPELKFGASGTAYSTFVIAVDRPKVAGDWSGERVTDFYECVAFKQLAENVAESLEKGNRVIVAGDGELETYKDPDGNERTNKRIVCNHVGAELRFATAQITKVKRQSAKTEAEPEAYADEPF